MGVRDARPLDVDALCLHVDAMPIRLIIAAILAALTFTGGYQVAARNYRLQIAEREVALAKQYDKQVQEAQDETLQWQRAKDQADVQAAARQAALADAAGRLRRERDGLRDQLTTDRSRLPNASCGSVREYAATLGAVFGECAAEAEGLAGQASGHASDTLKLLQSWPVP